MRGSWVSLTVDDRNVVDIAAAEMMAPDSLVLITTGTQGEPLSALSRMSRGEHRSISITADDLIILSSPLIPGNEEAVFGSSTPCRRSVPGWSPNQQARVHVSGHAYAGGSCCSLQRHPAPERDAGARHLAPPAGQRQTGRSHRGAGRVDHAGREWGERGPRGRQATIAGAAPVGKMFIDGLVSGDVGDATLGSG